MEISKEFTNKGIKFIYPSGCEFHLSKEMLIFLIKDEEKLLEMVKKHIELFNADLDKILNI